VRVVRAEDVRRTQDEMEFSLDVASEQCPYCGAVNLFPGFSRMTVYTCRQIHISGPTYEDRLRVSDRSDCILVSSAAATFVGLRIAIRREPKCGVRVETKIRNRPGNTRKALA